MASLDRIINKNNTSDAWVNTIINKSSTSRDDSWTWPPVEPGKLNCILCEKVVTFFHGSTNEFFEHIEIDHKIFINHSLLLSIIFLDNGTLNDIRDRFRQNLNALKVTGSAGLEEPFDVYEEGSFGDDGDEFDEDKTFHDYTKVLEQNEKETLLSRKENFCNNQSKGNYVLKNVPKYKPGPKSYKNKQDKINKINDILRESEKHPDFKKNVKCTKNVFNSLNENPRGQLTMEEKHNSNKNFQPLKNILESDTNNERGANFVQHIQPTKHFNNSEVINHINLSEAESVEAKFVKISTLVSPSQDDQFKSDDTLPPNWKSIISRETYFVSPDGSKFPSRERAVEYMKQMGIYTEQDYEKVIAKKTFNSYKPGPKSRKNKRKLKEVKNEILKIQKEIDDDVNSPNYNFLDNDWSKLDVYLSGPKPKSYDSELVESDEVKRQKISEPNPNSASSMIDEIKHIEEEMKNIIYYDIIKKDNEKDAKAKKLERSIKNLKQRTASDKDRLSSKYESDVPNEDINLRKHEEIDSKHTNPGGKSKKSEQSQNSGIKYPINVKLSEYFLKRPNQLSGYNISESVKNQFVFDESLPNGWKIRKIWRENKNLYDIDYLSPDGRKARSKVAVLEYMKLMGVYSLQDYDKIIQNYDLNLYKICT